MFSVVCVSFSLSVHGGVDGSHVTITRDELDINVQGPFSYGDLGPYKPSALFPNLKRVHFRTPSLWY